MVNRLPAPGLQAAWMVPPCNPIMGLAIARPNPDQEDYRDRNSNKNPLSVHILQAGDVAKDDRNPLYARGHSDLFEWQSRVGSLASIFHRQRSALGCERAAQGIIQTPDVFTGIAIV